VLNRGVFIFHIHMKIAHCILMVEMNDSSGY